MPSFFRAVGRFSSWLKTEGRPVLYLAMAGNWLCLAHLFWRYGYSYEWAYGPSMLPTFGISGTPFIISNLHRHGRGVEVGDIVTYDIPFNDQVGVKRVLGMPGDYVLVHTPGTGEDQMMQVPWGHCWLVGDNLHASRDSRMFGPVPLGLIRGKVLGEFALGRFKKIENPLKTGVSR